MLALSTRRQHLPQQHQQRYSPAASSPPSPHHLSYDQLPQQLASQHFFNEKLLHDYLDSQQQSLATPASGVPDSFMTSTFDFASPAIRVQRPTPIPTPQLAQTSYSQPPMLSTGSATAGLESWNPYAVAAAQQSLHTSVESRNRTHQRAASSSSAGSSASQYQAVGPSTGYQHFSNHLPTPTHTPTSDSFINTNNFNAYTPTSGNMDHTMVAHMSMKQAVMDQGDDLPEFAHSARQSVSSYGHDSPATPHTAHGDDADFKMPSNDMRQPIVPKFERTYTDIAADNFYDPGVVAAPSIPHSKPAQSSLLSPYRSNPNDSVQRALQAAQYARSQSPGSSASRGDSPFRRGSPYRQTNSNYSSPLVGSTAAAVREQIRHADAAYAMKSQMQHREDAEPKTISPKDALLDYVEADEEAKMPLFSDGASEYEGQYSSGNQARSATQTSYDATPAQSFRRDAWSAAQYSSGFPTSAAPTLPQAVSFDFSQPAVQSSTQNLSLGASSQYRSTPSRMASVMDQTPEFPAHLTSMESSASEAEPPSGSQNSDLFMRKPTSSSANSGTYSCTYHGCSQRFETPQKLQKHKREGHRNANLSAAMTSAAILERNSQAGPHKCDRINPTTGKPCSTIFSRPYDLTRHEDTIHNVRKQKVRCALCVEEKTFSRNDALTRHMRVVHPEIDFPGKHRRRGGNHD